MRLDQLLCAESLRDLFLEGSEYMAYLYKSGNSWHIETMDGRHTENFLDHEAPIFFKNIDLRTRYAPDPKALVQAFAHKNVDSIIVRVDQEKLEPYLSEKDRTAFAGEDLDLTKMTLQQIEDALKRGDVSDVDVDKFLTQVWNVHPGHLMVAKRFGSDIRQFDAERGVPAFLD